MTFLPVRMKCARQHMKTNIAFMVIIGEIVEDTINLRNDFLFPLF